MYIINPIYFYIVSVLGNIKHAIIDVATLMIIASLITTDNIANEFIAKDFNGAR